MAKGNEPDKLGSRERQIMDIVYRRGRATAAEVQNDLPDPPTNSAVRGMLRLLEEKPEPEDDQVEVDEVHRSGRPPDSRRNAVRRGSVQLLFGSVLDEGADVSLEYLGWALRIRAPLNGIRRRIRHA